MAPRLDTRASNRPCRRKFAAMNATRPRILLPSIWRSHTCQRGVAVGRAEGSPKRSSAAFGDPPDLAPLASGVCSAPSTGSSRPVIAMLGIPMPGEPAAGVMTCASTMPEKHKTATSAGGLLRNLLPKRKHLTTARTTAISSATGNSATEPTPTVEHVPPPPRTLRLPALQVAGILFPCLFETASISTRRG